MPVVKILTTNRIIPHIGCMGPILTPLTLTQKVYDDLYLLGFEMEDVVTPVTVVPELNKEDRKLAANEAKFAFDALDKMKVEPKVEVKVEPVATTPEPKVEPKVEDVIDIAEPKKVGLTAKEAKALAKAEATSK